MPIKLTEEKPKQVPKQANSNQAQNQQNPFAAQMESAKRNLKTVKSVIAIHSGKGGVGKSTFSANLAAALAKEGHIVGILDADVDCPSINKMFGLNERVKSNEKGRIMPLKNHGIKVLSVGNMVESASKANVMRGPIMFKLIHQMLADAEWGILDYLIIDLPPGTGDNPLTVMQLAPLSGLIIVTQPQETALADARKSADMAKRLNVPLLGVAENMSGEIFGTGGAEKLSNEFSVPFLGKIPLQSEIREGSDAGKPTALENESVFKLFSQIAEKAGL